MCYNTHMDLLAYISDTSRRRAALAAALPANATYLYHIATGWRGSRPSPALAQKIEAATAALGPETVTKESLRPDIWA